MRHLFLLSLFLLAPLSPLHSAQEPPDAVAQLRSDAEQGDIDAQMNLGVLYEKGDGVPQDYVKARAWYLKAAEQDDIDAQFNLGLLYLNGHGVKQDYVEARNWFLKAAEQGDIEAQFNLGLLYCGGYGVGQDYVEARDWWLKAAEHGYVEAQYTLGLLYYGGHPVAQHLKWFPKVAGQGNAKSQMNLGVLRYEKGDGVARDYSMAYIWWDIAAARGHGAARKYRDAAAAKLDPASLAEAQKLSTEYFKRYVEPFQ